ncbi:MAG: VIT1/CCC1 transporter family protein [DPANN group archaeon]|nr:VIT1/CCC1 transporter family protein [DPANN group archaeon]
MARQAVIRKKHIEPKSNHASSRWRDFILGWQDGLVNVLGVVLGVATATKSFSVIIIAAVAAAFAESISMAAVAYTSFKAEHEYYLSQIAQEKREIKDMPAAERQEIFSIYKRFGFTGGLLKKIVAHITSNKKRWLKVMMEQELKIYPLKVSPLNTAIVVGFSAIIGSFIPIVPFFFLPIDFAIKVTLVISTATLFFVGAYKAKTTVGSPLRSGVEMAVIGMLAALAGYAIGTLLGARFV